MGDNCAKFATISVVVVALPTGGKSCDVVVYGTMFVLALYHSLGRAVQVFIGNVSNIFPKTAHLLRLAQNRTKLALEHLFLAFGFYPASFEIDLAVEHLADTHALLREFGLFVLQHPVAFLQPL